MARLGCLFYQAKKLHGVNTNIIFQSFGITIVEIERKDSDKFKFSTKSNFPIINQTGLNVCFLPGKVLR